MDLKHQYEIIKRELEKLDRQLINMENEGDYGTDKYELLVIRERELTEELDSLEEEFDR